MRLFRSLYFRIFGWFWLTVSAGSILVLAMTVFTGVGPLGNRWMRLTQDLYAHSAVEFYVSGGAPALSRYFDVLRESSGMEAVLLDANGRDVLGGAIPAELAPVLHRSLDTGQSSVRLARVWSAASPVMYGDRRYIFLVLVHPMRGFVDGTFARPMALRLSLALVVAGLCCWLLTRSLVAPIRALQAASLRLASGDLASRVLPAMADRDDELADTARAFDRMADRVQGMIQKRQELLADISHELRSPLTRLSVSLELMRRGEDDVLEQMQTDLDRMNETIGQVLLLARFDRTDAQPMHQAIDLRAMLAAIAEDAEYEGQALHKRVVVSGLESCHVAGDATLLRSCMENVVRNAVRYTADGTAVQVRIAAGSFAWVVEVSDEGPGVPEESLARLFEPFYRVSESRARAEGGTGLGLSISQRVLKMHGGSIAASNRASGGLNVRMTLPREM